MLAKVPKDFHRMLDLGYCCLLYCRREGQMPFVYMLQGTTTFMLLLMLLVFFRNSKISFRHLSRDANISARSSCRPIGETSVKLPGARTSRPPGQLIKYQYSTHYVVDCYYDADRPRGLCLMGAQLVLVIKICVKCDSNSW